jgi:hypothetical protein
MFTPLVRGNHPKEFRWSFGTRAAHRGTVLKFCSQSGGMEMTQRIAYINGNFRILKYLKWRYVNVTFFRPYELWDIP